MTIFSKPIKTVCALLCSLVLLSGCASTSDISTRYFDEDIPSAQQILLVARSAENKTRAQWEKICLSELSETDKPIVASYQVMPNLSEGYNQALTGWASQQTLLTDVLIFEISGLLLAPPQIPPGNEVSVERYNPEQPIGEPTWKISFGKKETQPTPPDRTITEVRVLTSKGKTRWEGLVTSHEANDITAIARSQCKALAPMLKRISSEIN